jgi:hypothetical protein
VDKVVQDTLDQACSCVCCVQNWLDHALEGCDLHCAGLGKSSLLMYVLRLRRASGWLRLLLMTSRPFATHCLTATSSSFWRRGCSTQTLTQVGLGMGPCRGQPAGRGEKKEEMCVPFRARLAVSWTLVWCAFPGSARVTSGLCMIHLQGSSRACLRHLPGLCMGHLSALHGSPSGFF